jgi:hypothetical protein
MKSWIAAAALICGGLVFIAVSIAAHFSSLITVTQTFFQSTPV